MSKYVYLVVYQEDSYGPIFPTRKAFFSPAKAQEYCKKLNDENEEGNHFLQLHFFTREIELIDEV